MNKALQWYYSLSLNEQKAYALKHLLNFEFSAVWNYAYAKHVRRDYYIALREKIWKGEGSPIIII